MNVGYENLLLNDSKNMVCPICGKNIYVNKYATDYACVDINCPLGHGANRLITKIKDILK